MAISNQDGPDPTGAKTAAEFMQLLREARSQSGLAFVEIAQRAREKGYDLSSATVAEALEGDRLPEWQVVTGVLAACGYAGMQIDRWMRVYHDLAAPAQPVSAVPVAAAATAVQEPIDVEPISVPPLVLTAAPATPSRLGPKHFAFAAAVLAALIVVPLMLFNLFDSEPETVAGQPTGAAPRTSQAAPPPSPTDVPVVQPSPTEPVAPTTPAPVTTTARPPSRTSAPPAPPPPPPPPPPPADPGVLRSGVVALTGNQGFDLDSGQINGEHDFFRWDSDTLFRSNGGRLEPMPDGMPTKQACAAEEGWENRVDGLAAGQWLCVRTSDGRLARLNVTAVGSTLKLAYLVWT